MMTEKPLTSKQRTILEAILFLIGKGNLPTVREVGSLVGLRSPATVLKHLRVLEKASLISVSGKSRGIRISDPELLERVFQDRAGEITNPSDTPRDRLAGSRFSSSESLAGRSSGVSAGRSSGVSAGTSEGGSSGGSSPGRRLDDILQTHLPDIARLTTHGFLAFRRLPDGNAPPPRRIPLAGAIAAGHPFESYSDAYVPDEFFVDDKIDDTTAASSSSTVSAGGPTLEIDPKVFCDNGEVLALKVEGDSMVDAGILDGDYAIIRRQNTVEEGEIAAVIINGEGTLKRWSCNSQGRFGFDPNRKTSISLLPENDNFDPIEITEDEGKDVLVIGKYVGLIRGIQPLL